MRLNRPSEAVRKFERVDVDHGWLRHYGQLWEWWAGAHHMQGKHREELNVAGAGRARFPESLEMIRTEIRARAALRQFDQVTQLMNESLTMPPEGSSPAEVAWVAAQELAAHGRPNEAAEARKWLHIAIADPVAGGDNASGLVPSSPAMPIPRNGFLPHFPRRRDWTGWA
jgi:hypothetical protein